MVSAPSTTLSGCRAKTARALSRARRWAYKMAVRRVAAAPAHVPARPRKRSWRFAVAQSVVVTPRQGSMSCSHDSNGLGERTSIILMRVGGGLQAWNGLSRCAEVIAQTNVLALMVPNSWSRGTPARHSPAKFLILATESRPQITLFVEQYEQMKANEQEHPIRRHSPLLKERRLAENHRQH